MLIHKLDSEKASEAYQILCQGVHPWEQVTEAPFASSWCVVRPGKIARAHKHQEHEAFFIFQGRGLMRVNGERAEVVAGDVVFMQAWSLHELTNLESDQDLIFLDLCWEKLPEAVRGNTELLAGTGEERPARVLVTATPPTPNGDLHVGHLSGPYLGADIYARYLRMRGVEVDYVTGMDDHQSYVVTKAAALGATPREVAERFSETMAGTLERASIALDHVARPQASRHHVRLVQEVFRTLWEGGALVARESPTLYCEDCARYLFEAHVSGRCPHCGAGSGGNACEACGRPNDSADLGDPRCHHCGKRPAVRPLRRIYFPLAPWRDELERFWNEVRMGPHLRSLCETMLAAGLPEIAVSQQTDWGIPVPVAGFERQCIYVWFEMAPGYLAAARELREARQTVPPTAQGPAPAGGRGVWGGDGARPVQFFGFDNGYFHAVLFPAIFRAYDPQIPLPAAFVTNELYRYEGTKFSTSRDHALWGRELLSWLPADAARFYLAWDGPETEARNFALAALEETLRRELIGEWEPWFDDLSTRLEAQFAGRVPGTGAWTEEHQRFYQELLGLVSRGASAYEAETFSPQRAVRGLCELVRTARSFGKAQEHWQGVAGRYEEQRTAMALEILAVRALGQLAAPLMPDFAAALWRDLGEECSLADHRWEEVPEFVSSGRELGRFDGVLSSLGTVVRALQARVEKERVGRSPEISSAA